jgi:hypothetical protein
MYARRASEVAALVEPVANKTIRPDCFTFWITPRDRRERVINSRSLIPFIFEAPLSYGNDIACYSVD